MLGHYVAVAVRAVRRAPFASLINLLTLAIGLVCFVTAYAFATFWGAAERHVVSLDDVARSDEPDAGRDHAVALLLGGFSRPVLIANVIAWPAGYFAARAYLNQFAEPIELTPWPFVASVAITLAIAWLAVVGQSLRAARIAPAAVLRHE